MRQHGAPSPHPSRADLIRRHDAAHEAVREKDRERRRLALLSTRVAQQRQRAEQRGDAHAAAVYRDRERRLTDRWTQVAAELLPLRAAALAALQAIDQAHQQTVLARRA